MTATAEIEASVESLAIDCPEADRVGKWLAKNDRYNRSPSATPPSGGCGDGPLQHQQAASSLHAESGEAGSASDDSGRPSSVDTNEAASPRAPGIAVAASAGAGVAAAAAACADRSKVVRGVSPVPGDDNDVIHQFLIPNKLGGAMVGTRGRNINYIRAKSGASVWISRNFFDKKTQVVNVRGPVDCVKAALQVIKKRFPELDVKPINTAVPIQRNPALQPTMCQLSLPVGALVDVNVCAMCRGTTLFMQQPTHPSFHHLEKMDYTIRKHYADQSVVPSLPRPVNPGAVCVAPFGTSWYRAIIADVYPEDDMVLMKYLDWGGYERMPVGCLKQIRTEMMHLPFQAVEGHLAYVSPLLTADEDPETQLQAFSRLVHENFIIGRRVKCQVVYYNDVNQPCVYLFTREGAEPWRLLQEDLVQAGLAQWFSVPRVQPQMPVA